MLGWCEMLRYSLGIESIMSVEWVEERKETEFGSEGLRGFILLLVIV
jgi:hypothetical protein